jgi:RNA polymerase sigma-70 factor (ECF subfamily)
MHNIDEPDDSALVLQCQQGDKQAYGVLVKKYMKRAYFTALGLVGSHEDALDISQEAFVRAYRSLATFNPQMKFFTWFYRILRNLCLNLLRDRSRHAYPFSQVSDEEVENVSTEEDIALLVEQDDMKRALWKAIERLNEHEREIIILKEFQEMSYKEIAEMLECPIGTVMSRLYHARKALKEQMKEYLE